MFYRRHVLATEAQTRSIDSTSWQRVLTANDHRTRTDTSREHVLTADVLRTGINSGHWDNMHHILPARPDNRRFDNTQKKKKCPRRKMSNDNTSWQHPLVTTHTVLLHNTHEGSGRKGNETLQGITDIASVRVINNCIASCTIDRQLLRQLRREKRFCLLYNAKSGNNYRYAVDRINT